ncbi:MAG TPA: SDR family NAD(P)-dependent oxidoreductase [Candidatus Acidoferrum sp.]|nr:SDR family NAD(P)-dependent oxidoreductase [Candidatus Acidoferrum sp.]
MRVLVTGGLGFIGCNVANRLLREGHDVIIFDNARRAGVMKNLEWLREHHTDRVNWINADVRDAAAVRKAADGASAIFHLAGQVAVTTSVENPQEDFAINAQGTLNVLEAARNIKPLPVLLFTSTNKVYGGIDHVRIVERPTRYEYESQPDGISESCPLDFHSPYGCSKGAADQYVRDYFRIYGLPTVVLRMSCIYGPRQFGNEDQGWVAHFALTGLRGGDLTIYGDGKQVRDLLYVDDLVEVMMRCVSQPDRVAGEIFNIGGGPANTISVWHELRDPLAKLIGKLPNVTYGPFRPGDQRVYISDIRKAQRQLAWTPKVGVAEGLKRMVEQWGPQWMAAKIG